MSPPSKILAVITSPFPTAVRTLPGLVHALKEVRAERSPRRKKPALKEVRAGRKSAPEEARTEISPR
jgi:hypothetical protein